MTTRPYDEMCAQIAKRMKALIHLADSRDTTRAEWDQLDNLKDLVDTVVEEVPKLEDYFTEFEQKLEPRRPI